MPSSYDFVYNFPVTIDYTKVYSGSHTDFPVLFSLTTGSFRTIPFGGTIRNNNGYDIAFFTDSTLTTQLDWEMERYSPSTGEVIAWIKIPTLSSVNNTNFYVAYSNSYVSGSLTSGANAWNSGFKGVWHFTSGSGLNTEDSTVNNFDFTNTQVVPDLAKIASGAYFDAASGAYLTRSVTGIATGPATVSMWYTAGNPASGRYYLFSSNSDQLSTFIDTAGSLYAELGTGNQINTSNTSGSVFLVVTHDGIQTLKLYKNGSLAAQSSSFPTPQSMTTFELGRRTIFSTSYLQGVEDEVRLSNVARNLGWIQTEYANQFSPNTFYTTGAEQYTQSNNYAYKRQVIIDKTKVSGSNLDFPVLFSVTTGSFRTREYSGSVYSHLGYDIGFFYDPALSTAMSWEMEKYSPSTGEVIAWVKVPNVNSTSGASFFVAYGLSGTTSFQSTGSDVWTNAFQSVWHLNQSSGSIIDSTINAKHGSVVGAVTTTTGKIGTALSTQGGSGTLFNYVNAPPTVFGGSGPSTIGIWINTNTLGQNRQSAFLSKENYPATGWTLIDNSGFSNEVGARFQPAAGSQIASTVAANVNGTWHYLVGVANGTDIRFYLDSTLTSTKALAGALGGDSTTSVTIGYFGTSGTSLFEEARVSNVARTASWIITEYNNQNSPTTFLNLGEEYGGAAVDELFYGDDFLINASTFIGGRVLKAGPDAGIGGGYIVKLNRKDEFTFGSYTVIPVNNTRNERQQFDTIYGDFILHLQGDEVVDID